VRRLPGTNAFMHTSDVTPDGKLAVAGGFDGILRFWDVNTGKLLHKFTPPKEDATKVAARK
jgi:WD40 repeat protein